MRTLWRCGLIFVFFNLLPYLSRLPRGIQWVKQYLPDEGMLVPGLLFFHAFNSLPAVVLIYPLATKKTSPLAFCLTFLTMSILIVLANKDYDLASDAQAAIGLVVFPLYIAGLGIAVHVLCLFVEKLLGKR